MHSELSTLEVQITESLEKANKGELKDILKNFKFYRELVKKVGKRGQKIYHNTFDGINDYTVEYYGGLEKSYVLEKAREVYKNIFDIEVKNSDIKMEKKDKIKGGMKIYLNDNLLDLSFLRFHNLLKK